MAGPTFGYPNPRISFLNYCAEVFLKESTRLYVTRVVNSDALTACAYITVDDPDSLSPIIKITCFDDGNGKPLGRHNPLETVGFVLSSSVHH